MKKSGFTFVELMIAVVIGAFVTVTAVAAMRGIFSGSQKHQRLTEFNDEIRYACSLLKQDLNNIYRNSDFKNAKFELSYLDGGDGLSSQSLTLFTASRKKTRSLQPEGDIYEVQYSIDTDAELERSVLMRRCCPALPGIPEGRDIEAGGILVPIAENITGVVIRCYDGSEWVDTWDQKKGRFPELVEVAILATDEKAVKKTLKRSFFASISRLETKQDVAGQEEQDDTDNQPDYDSYMSDEFSDISQEEGAE